MLKFMLDTDTVIFTMNRRPEHMREMFKLNKGQMAISTVTLGELIFGAEKSAKPEHNLQVVEGFAARLEVLPFDTAACTHWGQVRNELRKAGTPIGPYDQMLAGHARSLGLILVTHNTREFRQVGGLRLEDWVIADP